MYFHVISWYEVVAKCMGHMSLSETQNLRRAEADTVITVMLQL